MSNTAIVVCAEETTPLRTGSKGGYQCANCGKKLQATSAGRGWLASGGVALCNTCGFKLAKRATELNKVAGVEFSEAALVELNRMRKEQHQGN